MVFGIGRFRFSRAHGGLFVSAWCATVMCSPTVAATSVPDFFPSRRLPRAHASGAMGSLNEELNRDQTPTPKRRRLEDRLGDCCWPRLAVCGRPCECDPQEGGGGSSEPFLACRARSGSRDLILFRSTGFHPNRATISCFGAICLTMHEECAWMCGFGCQHVVQDASSCLAARVRRPSTRSRLAQLSACCFLSQAPTMTQGVLPPGSR